MEEDILARGEDFFSVSLFPVLNSRPEIFRTCFGYGKVYVSIYLSSVRNEAPQRISMSEVNSAYCEFKELFDPDDRDDFLYHVQKLDSVFMKDWLAKNPTKGKGGKPERLGSL
jgi:hypothetical protein